MQEWIGFGSIDFRLKRLNQIQPLIENGEVVLFFGAGMSAIAGCWTWRKLVRELLKHPIIQGKLNLEPDPQSRLEDIIGYCKREFERTGKIDDFQDILENTTKVNLEMFKNSYTPIIEKITSSLVPLPKVLTTNIDDCLDYTYDSGKVDIYCKIDDLCPSNLTQKKAAIFHLHGHKKYPEDVVFTSEEYVKRYNSAGFKEFLIHIFTNKTVVFIGYGLSDNELNRILLEVKSGKADDEAKVHYALVPTEDEFSDDRCKILRYNNNLEVIRYGSRDKFAQTIGEWLNEMSQDKLIKPPTEIGL